MTPEELKSELQAAGVELWTDGDMLRFRAPAGTLEPRYVRALRQHKKDLVRIISGEEHPKKTADVQFGPASIGQQALWYLHNSDRQSPAYNVASVARIRSPINLEAFSRAFQAFQSRHDSLRTVFVLKQGQLTRKVLSQQPLDFQRIDVAGRKQADISALVRQEYERPFQLDAGPLFRVRLFREDPANHVFLVVLHHIVFDAWSLWMMQEEFQKLYAQELDGSISLLPSTNTTYDDFARWQIRRVEEGDFQEHWDYWKTTLHGAVEPVKLPTDHAPAKIPLRGRSHKFSIPAETIRDLNQMGRGERATPFMTLLAVFQCLLSRYTSQNDLVIGIGAGGRTKPAYASVIGYFVNTLPIRATIDTQSSFRSVLKQTRMRVVEALSHQDYPFPCLVKQLNPQRGNGAGKFCNVMFGLQKPQQEMELGELLDTTKDVTVAWGDFEISPYELDQQEGQFDLNMELLETGRGFLGVLKYNSHLFEKSTIERLAHQFLKLSEQVAKFPDAPLNDLDILTEDDVEHLKHLSGSSIPMGDWTSGMPFIERFEQLANQQPHAVAIKSPGVLTYEALDARANRIAEGLRRRGVQPGDVVASGLDRGVDSAALLLAIFKTRAIYVPLDLSLPQERLERILADCKPRVVLSQRENLDGLGRLLYRASSIVAWEDFWESIPHGTMANAPRVADPADAAYIIYTSGSTGIPKGVVVSQTAISLHTQSIAKSFSLRPTDCVLQFAQTTFDPSIEQLLTPWGLGASVAIRPDNLWTPQQFWEELARHEITVANLPPAYFRECTGYATREIVENTRLRLVIVGGDVFPEDVMEFWSEFPVQILNAYGPTESVITATVFDLKNRSEHDPVLIGRPKPGMSAYVLTAEQELAPWGAAGELCLGGEILASGYLNDRELTQQRFIPDPFSNHPNARLYRTGDRARWTFNGELEFLGRIDRQVQVNGIRVEPADIESQLAKHEQIQEVAVVCQTVRDGESSLVGYFLPDSPGSLTVRQIKDFARQALPASMVPKHYLLLEKFPRNASGKVDYGNLPQPDLNLELASRDGTPPRSDVEAKLVKIWEEVFQICPIGIHDHFLDLGGGSFDSLRIAALAADSGLELQTGEMTPDLLFRYSTIAELAEQIQFKKG